MSGAATPFDQFDAAPQPQSGGANPFDKFDGSQGSKAAPQDPGIWRNLAAGLGEGVTGVSAQVHDALDPAAVTANMANEVGGWFGHKGDIIPQKYIPGSQAQLNETLKPIGLSPGDVTAPTAADRVARTVGTGASAALLPGDEGAILPTLGQVAGRAFAGMASGAGSGALQETVPERYKPLASFLGAVGTGIPGAMTAERMFGAPTAERAGRLQDTQQLASDFSDSGVPTSGAAAAITGSKTIGATQAALRNYFTSAQTMGDAAKRTLNGFKTFADRVAAGYGSAQTGEDAGQSLQSGARSFIQGFNNKASKLYDNLDQYVRPKNGTQAPVVLSNTAKMISDRLSPFADSPTIQSIAVPPKLSGILDDIGSNNGEVPWQTAKDLRSLVGQRIDSFGDDTGIPRATWKQLYGALSDDMGAAVADRGPAAQQAFDRANAFYAAGRHRIDNFIQPIIRSSAAEKAVSSALSGSAQGGTMLRTLRKSLPAEDWGDFAGYQLRKMGTATPGAQDATGAAFSPSTFLTNWNKFSPQAKDALFGGTSYAQLRPQLDALVRMSGAMKGVEGMANTSRTAGTLGTLEAIGSGAAMLRDPLAGLGTVVAPYAAAKLMTSPGFVKFLSWRAGRILARKPVNPAMTQTMLKGVAKSEPDVADEVQQYLQGAATSRPRQPIGASARTGTGP